MPTPAPPTIAERIATLNVAIAMIHADAERTSRRARELDAADKFDDATGQSRN